MNETATKIRAFRESHGWSQEELARRLSVSVFSVCRWECGTTEPRGAIWLALETLDRQESQPTTAEE